MTEHVQSENRYEDILKSIKSIDESIKDLSEEEQRLNTALFKTRYNSNSSDYKDLVLLHDKVSMQLDALLLEKRNLIEEKIELEHVNNGTASVEENCSDIITESDLLANQKDSGVELKKEDSGQGTKNTNKGNKHSLTDTLNTQYSDFVTEHALKEKEMLQAGASTAASLSASLIKRGVKGALTTARSTFNSSAKISATQLANKINPLEQKINMNDVTDTGMESLRVAYQGGKRTINAVKTVKNTAKTTGKAAEASVKTVYNTAKTTVKVTGAVLKFIGTVWEHAIAAMLNPIIWVIAIIVLMIMLESMNVVLILQGYTEKTYDAYVSAKGLGKVDDEYAHGQELYRASELSKFTQFGETIASSGKMDIHSGAPGITYTVLGNSDLVQVQKTYADASGVYQHTNSGICWCTPEAKVELLKYWNMSVEEYQALAIAYVYLQKQSNDDEHTVMDIYDVVFTEELMNTIIDYSVQWTVASYSNCDCPGRNCCSDGHGNRYCRHDHTLYVIAITFYSKDDVMDQLGFSDKEKEWESITEVYFKNKYYHATPVPTPEPEAGGTS